MHRGGYPEFPAPDGHCFPWTHPWTVQRLLSCRFASLLPEDQGLLWRQH